MQIVIDIPKKIYKEMQERTIITCGETFAKKLVTYIKRGTPLPEHHGRIIDESKINKVFYNTEEVIYNNIKAINTTITHTDAPTIIEGSKSECRE